MKRLEGKVALITGTGDGIGRGIALAFAHEGADLAICDINETELNRTRDLLTQAGRNVFSKTFDLRNVQEIEKFTAEAAQKLGRLDILVNNAAVMPVAPIEELTEATVDLILNVNLKAPILFSKFAIPHLRKTAGTIIHMASVTGHNGHTGVAVYGATKGALMSLARGQAMELAPDGIRVNTVSPGTVDSPMLHRFLKDHVSDIKKVRVAWDRMHPRGKIASIEEVASVFVFLASNEAANITATDIRCDGGYCVQGMQPRD